MGITKAVDLVMKTDAVYSIEQKLLRRDSFSGMTLVLAKYRYFYMIGA